MSFKNKAYNLLLKVAPSGIKRSLEKIRLGHRLVNLEESYLVQTGYIESKINNTLRDKKGDFSPWFNYPLIEFLKERLNQDMSIFEYGSGASTIFFAKRTKSIISIEYDQQWYKKVNTEISNEENATLHYIPLDDAYPKAIEQINKGEKYDLIIIDGRKRVESALISYNYLSKKGVILFDDSQRKKYKEAFDFFKQQGYNSLRFKGIKPTGLTMAESTLIYKSGENCLNL